MSATAMPRIIKAYVRYVDAVNRVLGYFVMYLTLVMMGLLLFASVTRYVFNVPFVWIIEMAQFLMAAYYILGGGYSMQLDAHVRMDVLYERWRPQNPGLRGLAHGVLPGLLPGHHDSRRLRRAAPTRSSTTRRTTRRGRRRWRRSRSS